MVKKTPWSFAKDPTRKHSLEQASHLIMALSMIPIRMLNIQHSQLETHGG
jgi:hypothetical protein